MEKRTRFEERGYRVTDTAFEAPRRTFRLAQVEQTRLRRPGLLAVAALWAACAGLVGVFRELLYVHEVWVLLGAPVAILPLAAQLGVLTIEYRGMGGVGSVFGPVGRLARIRRAIDEAIDAREEQG